MLFIYQIIQDFKKFNNLFKKNLFQIYFFDLWYWK